MTINNLNNQIIGCILGTTVGDAIGLPYEGLSLRKQQKLTKNILKHRLIFNHGMVSDDTEHTIIVAQSLIVSNGDERIFANTLKWQLMVWLLTFPAGIGFATLRGILKLFLGFSPQKSGVFSAGNGPAMRSPIIGVCYGHNPEKMRHLVRISTRITHTDIKAEYGAVAVAIASYLSSQNNPIIPNNYYQQLTEIIPEATEFLNLIKSACDSVELGENSAEFSAKLGLSKGISGYIYHTVPVVIQIWLRYGNQPSSPYPQREYLNEPSPSYPPLPEGEGEYFNLYEKAITEIIKLGGDTDTTAAILGGIIGSKVGKNGIPTNWLNNIWLYPVNLAWLEHLGEQLTEVITNNKPQKYVTFPIYGIWFRNILFFFIVIGHLCYRLLIL
jgi:ADP-ribosyl-[dinitrogen reductase] hydrolase